MHTGTATLVSPQCRKLYNTEQPSMTYAKNTSVVSLRMINILLFAKETTHSNINIVDGKYLSFVHFQEI